ncbi:secreted protein [Candidatus Magnetomorum sp. HK-1]|nr:secreted protein [Candidatus Magnetomorum sp. HK-1]
MINRYISNYKTQILSAIIASLLTGFISMASGLYTLSKSFELTQKKDYVYQLKLDINLLQKTAKELDSIISLLFTNMKLEVEFEEYFPRLTTNENSSITVNNLQINGNHDKNILKMYKVKSVIIPDETFSLCIWPISGPSVTEINFDLVVKLNELYLKLFKINENIDNIWSLLLKERIGHLFHQKIKKLKKVINNNISDISSEKIVELKDNIRDEVNRLQKKIDY